MKKTPEARVVVKPVVPATDMAASIAFYQRLGFDVTSYDSQYAWVMLSGTEILHIRGINDSHGHSNHGQVYVHVQDVQAWHTAWESAGIDVGTVIDQPWEMREFIVTDPSGTTLRVGQNIDTR